MDLIATKGTTVVDNLTPFVSYSFYSLDQNGQWLQTVVTRGTYEILPDGNTRLADSQPELPHFDTYYGDPKSASLRSEHCRIPHKPRGEVYFVDPVARVAKPERSWNARFALGPIDVRFRVWGPRRFYRNWMGIWRTSEAELICEQPVRFEFAYGGGPSLAHQLDMNPVGSGHYLDHYEMAIRELPAPLFEFLERSLIRTPMALTPVHRAWLPRRAYAGTFDEAWRTLKAPLYPDNFDERFFLQAPSFMQLPEGYFLGNETVQLENLGTSGIRQIRLAFPRVLSAVGFDESNDAYSADLNADTLIFDLETSRVSVDWRTTFIAKNKLVEINVFEPEECHA